mgnify:CR=1 FL=1
MFKKTPIELNEENVLNIYNYCSVDDMTTESLDSNLLPTKIFTKSSCGQDSPEIIFDKTKIKECSSAITYLYGQLDFVHNSLETFFPESGFITYKHTSWTQNNSTLMALYYLGIASDTIPIFTLNPSTKKLSSFNFFITPTLSPSDPNYRKKGGQEPADD